MLYIRIFITKITREVWGRFRGHGQIGPLNPPVQQCVGECVIGRHKMT